MEKSAFIIQGVLLFYVLLGLCMATLPVEVNLVEKKILRSFRVISAQQARKPLGPKERVFSRIFGTCCLIGCLVVLLQMNLQIGRIPETPPSVWTEEFSHVSSDAFRLHQLVRDIVQPMTPKYVGLTIVTIADDTHDISGFGRINLNAEKAPDQKTLFEIGSLSKVFTGTLLAERVCNAGLSLQASLASFLPFSEELPISQTHDITLERLVTHTSGLPRMPAGTFRLANIWKMIVAGDSYQHYTEKDLLTTIRKQKAREGSDVHFRYSNAGFGVLGLILSKLRGMEYDEMLKTAIAEPLGLKDTAVLLNEEQRSRLATGYRSYARLGAYYLAQRADTWNFPNCVAGAGGIRSSARDMLVFLQANMGQIRSELGPALQQSHKPLFNDEDVQIGMGWFHKKLPISNEAIIWHNGGTGGYRSFLAFSSNGRFGVCVLSNSTQLIDDIGYTILEKLVAEA